MPPDLEAAVELLESRCAAIDLHYERFPNSLDRTMEDTAKAIRTLIAANPQPTEVQALREALADLIAAHHTTPSSAKIKHAAFLKARAALSASEEGA